MQVRRYVTKQAKNLAIGDCVINIGCVVWVDVYKNVVRIKVSNGQPENSHFGFSPFQSVNIWAE